MGNRLSLIQKKYQIGRPSFWNGFLFFFGMCENPYEKAFKFYASRNVNESLQQDWYTVGEDFKKSIEKHRHLLVENEK